uniref:Glutathione peroxidase n=1 Tax=Oryzias sinensis TaxID=183150 RepID=A0A8C7WY16_9TELE
MPKMLRVLLSMTVGVGCLFLLQIRLRIKNSSDFYSFEVQDAKGRTVSLEKYRGKASLVVNVASHCEHTEANFRFLQDLHRELGTAHFNVLAFPCGQFGTTELGLSRDIEAFAKNTYGLTFPFFGKIRTFGSEAEPAFKFLTGRCPNFHEKYIYKWMHHNGAEQGAYGPLNVAPTSPLEDFPIDIFFVCA